MNYKDDKPIDVKFSNIFKGIGSFLDLITEMAEKNKNEVIRKGNLNFDNKKSLSGMYNFSVKLGALDEKSKRRKAYKRQPEPITDIFDEGDHYLIILEVPQKNEDDLIIRLQVPNKLEIQSTDCDIDYTKEIYIPSAVSDEDMTWSLKNNILEIRLKKDKG